VNASKRIQISLLALLACASSAGCALTSRSEPMPMRYFSAEAAAPASTRAQRSALAPGSDLPLRLDRVRSSSHLADAIAYRSAEHEVGYYEGEHWTERPSDFLERALERALYQDQGLKRVISGASETLVVELTSFEEIRGPRPVARFEATITLHDEATSQLVQTVRVERPIAPSQAAQGDSDDAPPRVVAALAAALEAGVDQIAQVVAQKLGALAAAEAAEVPPPAAVAEETRRDGLR
jgi:ABC-type uncharacterized transport system auxiliary subunit